MIGLVREDRTMKPAPIWKEKLRSLEASAIWERLDHPGIDEANLTSDASGYLLSGESRYMNEQDHTSIEYQVRTDSSFLTQQANVMVRTGKRRREIHIEQAQGKWTLNGKPQVSVQGLVDLDFGFTPATNYFQIRRLGLVPGQECHLTTAWMDADSLELEPLFQIYRRISDRAYYYRSPSHFYGAMLELLPNGFVRNYPTLWTIRQEPPVPRSSL